MTISSLARFVLASSIVFNSWATTGATATSEGNLRSGRELSFDDWGLCLYGCSNGSYDGWWDLTCTCESNWDGRCCGIYIGQCTEGMTELCAADNLSEESFSTNDLFDQNDNYQGPITIGTIEHNLPVNMQGVFWLQDQMGSSSLISMATSRDGNGLSVWNANSERHISVRVGGDRVWSFASKGSAWELVEGIDLVYHFEGTPQSNPTHFNIIPEAQNQNFELSGDFFEWALNFEMNFIEPGTAEHDYPAVGDRPAAVMWARPSQIVGIDAGEYKVAQVINGNGQRTAAYDAWVAYNQDGEEWQDNTIWYHSA